MLNFGLTLNEMNRAQFKGLPTIGSRSPPTSALTAPSLNEIILTVLLSLSAKNKQLRASSLAADIPDGWANAALCGYELFLFSSLPLPAYAMHVPSLWYLKEKKRILAFISPVYLPWQVLNISCVGSLMPAQATPIPQCICDSNYLFPNSFIFRFPNIQIIYFQILLF